MKFLQKQYFISTYGCQMNVHDSEKISGILAADGYVSTEQLSTADIIVFNTCCIRETAEKKIIGHLGQLKKLKRQNPNIIIVLCGCMTQQVGAAEQIKEKYPFVDVILGTHNTDELSMLVKAAFEKKKTISVIETEGCISENIPVLRTSMPNAWVNIVYGCNNFCSYCIVPYVRGRERSRGHKEIISEVQSLVSQGYKEITLLGQNVNSYGNDIKNGLSFAALLNELCKIPGKFRLSFMTSHPKDFTDELIAVINDNHKISRHIHLPVQAGSNDVLRAMNRKYTRDDYILLAQRIKDAIPDVKLTTDIMVGFNGETDENFSDTLDLVAKCRFSSAFCFIFSKRRGTVAYDMPDEVSGKVKKERIKKLISLQNEITKQISEEYVGKIFEILVEGFQEKLVDICCGRTMCGRLVNFRGNKELVNNFVSVKILETKTATLWGELVR